MTAKEYLRRYRDLNAHIDSKLDEISHLRDVATRLSPTAMFNNNGDITDKVGRTAAKIVDLQAEIAEEVNEIVKIRAEIEQTIAAVSDADCRLLLSLRYINGYSWRRIAAKMSYTEDHVTGYLHYKALKLVTKILQK